MAYLITLTIHSWLRWLVLASGLIATGRALAGGSREWTGADDRAGLLFTVMLDLQVLFGILLYAWLSPITRQAFGDIGAAMKEASLRFWVVEHIFGMVIALALAHVGRVRIRKASLARRHRLAATFFGLALLAILLSIPWPAAPYGRPLLRW
jgi:hypothetical protein